MARIRKHSRLMLLASQIRAARALLGWRQQDLSKAANVGPATIYRIERGMGPLTGNVATVMRIQEAFERAGIRFVEDSAGGEIGVILKRKQKR